MLLAAFVCLQPVLAQAQTDGLKLWETKTGQVDFTPAMGPDGTIYASAGSPMGTPWKLYAIRPDGSIKWSIDGRYSEAVIAQDGTIYVSGEAGLSAINPDGNRKWKFELRGIWEAPALAENGTVYVASASQSGSKLHALNPDGTQQWEFLIGPGDDVTRPVIDRNGVVYTGTTVIFQTNHRFCAVNPDGTLKWSVAADFSAPTVGDDGTLYVTRSGNLYALNSVDGSEKWKVSLGAAWPPAIGSDGTLYGGSATGLYALNPDGSRKWIFTADKPVRCTPALSASGMIYFVSNNTFYGVHLDGTEAWTYPAGGISSPLILGNGTVVFGTFLQNFIALQASGSLMDSPWPMAGHDPQQSSRAGGTLTLRIDQHPASQSVSEGANVQFEVKATSSEPLKYQWRHNGVPIENATNAIYSIRLVRTTHQGTYDVVVYSSKGPAMSAAATLSVERSQSFVQRQLPDGFYLDQAIQVVLSARPLTHVLTYAVEDQPPAGWTVGLISHDGAFDPATGRVKFGPFHDHLERDLTYELTPPRDGAATVNTFTGIASIEGVPTPIQGDDSISFEAVFHPADADPADNAMSLDEVTAYGFAWKLGASWPVDPSPIPESHLDISVKLWRGGERYVYDGAQSDERLRWRNPTTIEEVQATQANPPHSAPLTSADTAEQSPPLQPGQLLWEVAVPEASLSPAVGPDGAIYVSGQKGLVVINPDGTPKLTIESATGAQPVTVAGDGTFYAGKGAFPSAFHAYTPEGVLKWTMEPQHSTLAALQTDGTVVVGAADKTFHAIGPDGTKKWNITAGPMMLAFRAAAVGPGDLTYVLASSMVQFAELYAVHPDGSIAWKTLLEGDTDGIPIAGENGTIYVLGHTHLFALDPSGSMKWKFRVEGRTAPWTGPAIGTDGTIYFGGSTNLLVAVNPDGTEKWRFTTDSRVSCTPAIAKDGTIFFASEKTFYAIGPDARLLWTMNAGGWRVSPALTKEGRLYFVGATSRKLYAVHAGSGLAESPWPMLGHDPAHTGRAGGTIAFRVVAQPSSVTVPAGNPARFSVTADGEGPFLYQWRFNGAAVPAATNSTLEIRIARERDSGTYDVLIRNAKGSGVSQPALLTVGPSVPFVERQLPSSLHAANSFEVSLAVQPAELTELYAIEDRPPAGWQVGSISHGGSYDPHQNKVKFGPFFDREPRDLKYEVIPPTNGSAAENRFHGAASANGVSSSIAGQQSIQLDSLLHPADLNPADSAITIDEAAAYAAAWRKGDVWPVDPNPVPIDYVTRSGMLWKRGESYVYDPAEQEPALRWMSASEGEAAEASGGQFTSQSMQRKSVRGSQTQAPNSAVRSVPFTYAHGQTVTVQITAYPGADTVAYALEDQPPANWTVTHISHEGAFDAASGRVKWGPFYDTESRVLSYQVQPHASASGAAQFTGTASYNGHGILITGIDITRPAGEISGSFAPDGTFQLQFDASTRDQYEVQVSEDLIHWSTLTTVQRADAAVTVHDAAAGKFKQRFYRVR